MIKKLIVAATFAGSTLVGVPAAQANSPAYCMQQYDAALVACGAGYGSTTPCAQRANIAFNRCLESLVTVND
jgi:hypothetical protein